MMMMMIRTIVVVIIQYHSASVHLAESVKTIFLGPAYQSNYCSVFGECLKGKVNTFGKSFSQC